MNGMFNDALPSPGVNPLEGSPKCSCGKLRLGRRSQLPTLERGRGSSWEPRDQTRKRDQQIKLESAPKQTTKWLVHISRHPWVLGTSHGNFDTRLTTARTSGVNHHLTPYSIPCTFPRGPHRNGLFVPGLPRGSPAWESRNCASQDSRNFEAA